MNNFVRDPAPTFKEPPPFAPAQQPMYVEYGGKLWEDLLEVTIGDSIMSLGQKSPGRKSKKEYTARALAEYEEKMNMIRQARRWLLGKEPTHLGMYKHGLLTGGIWQFLFSTDPEAMIEWLKNVWEEVDRKPSLVRYYKQEVGKRYYHGGNNG